MLKSTAIVLVVAGLVGAGVTAAILYQKDSALSRTQDAPSITSSTFIVIDDKGAQACSSWSSSASSCRSLGDSQTTSPDQQE